MPVLRASSPARPCQADGFTLIEVIVSALILVVVSLAVLTAFDGASKASGLSKSKSTAASIAQQDQERLRGMRPAELMAMGTSDPRPVPADGLTYTVTSKAEYRLEATTTNGCTGGQRDERLTIVSTVEWDGMGYRPVRVESMIAPPLESTTGTQGSAVLRLVRADGITGVSGVPVGFAGPQSGLPVSTGTEGCAFFGNYLTGAYTYTFSRAGWVDPTGDEQPDDGDQHRRRRDPLDRGPVRPGRIIHRPGLHALGPRRALPVLTTGPSQRTH